MKGGDTLVSVFLSMKCEGVLNKMNKMINETSKKCVYLAKM